MKGHISDVRIGGVHRPPLWAFLRHMFLGVFGDVVARRRYISTEYLFDELSTSFANQQAKHDDSVSRAAGLYLGRRVFSDPTSARTNIYQE